MKAHCPNNPEHREFNTVVHVTEHWIVDDSGNFIEVEDSGELVHGPNPGNNWYCVECNAVAEVKDA